MTWRCACAQLRLVGERTLEHRCSAGALIVRQRACCQGGITVRVVTGHYAYVAPGVMVQRCNVVMRHYVAVTVSAYCDGQRQT
jgi:hypothetical protein